MRNLTIMLVAVAVTCFIVIDAPAQSRRRMTPVETPATITQTVNEALTDSTRIKEARIARSTHYHDEQGRTVYVDTVTGEQWLDTAALMPVIKMKYPLLDAASVSVDIWDPLMRAFGQDYGLVGFGAELSLHNRYKPVFELGFGQTKHTPSGGNYTYRSPMSMYFRLGLNYNFLFNSSPDYQFYAGLRYGFSTFSYAVENATLNASYWDENVRFDIPSQRVTAGWFELVFGLRVKLWGPVSAGWAFKYHNVLHQSATRYGQAWYIPGYGSRNASVTGSFSISYTFSLSKMNKQHGDEVISTNVQPSAAEAPSDDNLTVE